MSNLELFRKKKKFLVCIDSDGCVMDSMNRKHEAFFAPALIEVWNLSEHASLVKKKWNDINLNSKDRGINRFLGLSIFLEEFQKEQIPIQGLQAIKEWTQNAKALSNEALEIYLENHIFADTNQKIALRRALLWSKLVNERIQMDTSVARPFIEVKETLEKIAVIADIAVVSSANEAALEDEWTSSGLNRYIKILCSQKEGSKSFCIEQLLQKGYEKSHSIMIGDAPGDLIAAQQNGINFYPIIAGDEELSWKNFRRKELSFFMAEEFCEKRQVDLIKRFYNGLSVNVY